MNPRNLVISAAVAGVILLVLLQLARPQRPPERPATDEAPRILATDLVAARPDFVTRVNRLAAGGAREQVRQDLGVAPIEDDGQMLGYCFPDHQHCSQRVVLRFNAQGRLYQVQSSVPHVPPRHFIDFQPPAP